MNYHWQPADSLGSVLVKESMKVTRMEYCVWLGDACASVTELLEVEEEGVLETRRFVLPLTIALFFISGERIGRRYVVSHSAHVAFS